MGIETKLFVTANKCVMFDLMPKLIDDINKWQRLKLDKEAKSKGVNRMNFLFSFDDEGVENRVKWSNGIRSVTTRNFGSFNIDFIVNEEHRSLFITQDCSCDYSDTYEGDKIIFSLNYWGISEEIMLVVADSVKEFGDVYYVPNDCSEEFKKINK